MGETTWLLFVDESGGFTEDDPGKIVGLLLQEGVWSGDQPDLCARLTAVSPLAPYPLHARDLNVPSFHLVTYLAAKPKHRVTHWAERDLQAAADAMARGPANLVHARDLAVEALGRPDGYRTARAFNVLVRKKYPDVFRLLAEVASSTRRRMAELLGDLARVYGADRCAIVGAAEPRGLESPEGADPYLNLLPVLFERLFMLLRGRPEERHRVLAWVADRPRQSGATLTDDLIDVSDVRSAIAQASELAWPSPANSQTRNVVISVVGTPAYTPSVVPGLVLADALANRIGFHMSVAAAWGSLEDLSRRECRLPVRLTPRAMTSRALPTMGASGRPREALVHAAGGEQVAHLKGVLPRWTGDQANEWLEAMKQATQGRGA